MQACDGLLTSFIAVPRSEPSRRPVTVTSCCRFSRRISFCGGSCVDVGQRAEDGGVPVSWIEDGVFDGVERGAVSSPEADADGVGAAVGDERIGGGHAVEDGGRVFGDLRGGEAEAGGDGGIDLEVGGRAADGVFDSVLNVDHAFDLADGVADARAEFVEQRWIGEKILIWIGSGALERSPMMSWSTWVNSTSSCGSVGLISARTSAMISSMPRLRCCLSLTVKSPVLASVTAARPICRPVRRAGAFDFGRVVEDLFDVVEDAVGLGERSCRRA